MNASTGDRGNRPGRPFAGFAFTLLLPFLAVTNAEAQVPDTLRRDTVYEIEPIGVRAVRPSTTPGGVSAVVIRLDSVRMRPAPILEHVLREIPLVQVRSNSRGEAQLAMRGAEERQIAILLDGVPLTLGWDHRTDLSVVPLTAAQRVTLVRGLSSILHGPNVLGGAVEISLGSVAGATPEPFRGAAGVESTGAYSVAVQAGAAADVGGGRVVVRAGAGHRDREGFAAPDDVESVYPILAAGDLRANSQSTLSDAFVTARWGGSGAWLAATGTGYTVERGVPPELTEPEPRLWRYPEASRVVGILTGGTGEIDTGVGTGDLTFSLGADAGSVLIHDFRVPPDAGNATSLEPFFFELNETEDADDLTLTARAVAGHTLGDAYLRAAVTYADVNHDEVITTGIPSGSPVRTPGSFRQRLWSVGAEVEVPFSFDARSPIRGGSVSGGLAWDGADAPETGGAGEGQTVTDWGGRLGVSATVAGGGLLLHAAASRRGRFPALREMYSTALGRFAPNPALRPEVLTAVEAGFTTGRGSIDVQVVGFHQRLDDAIVRGPAPTSSGARFQRINRDEIRSTGIEVLGGYTVGRLNIETELTLQDVEAIVRDPAAAAGPVRAEYEPEVMAGVGGSFPLPLGLEAGAEFEYVGAQFCSTPVNATERYAELEASTRADVQLARTFRLGSRDGLLDRIGVQLALDNALDGAVYDQCGLPQPGRTLRLQVRVD